MGRTLTNTMVNLGIQGECEEAMYQVLSLDVVAVLQNRLCQLVSMTVLDCYQSSVLPVVFFIAEVSNKA